MKRTIVLLPLFAIMISFISCQKDMKIKDERDGKTYENVKIGSQYWMSENLRYKPDNGIYWAYDDNEVHGDTVGFLYDWERACEVCPKGWHLPTRAEWDTLIYSLGGFETAGLTLRDTSDRWKTATLKEGSNSSSFSALPEGVRRYDGRYSYYNRYAYFWSISDSDKEGEAWCYAIDGVQDRIFRISWNKDNALSVRCVKDQ